MDITVSMMIMVSEVAADLIGSLSSRDTIWPGPTVQGPPVKTWMRQPVLGKAVSTREVAIEMATPVQR